MLPMVEVVAMILGANKLAVVEGAQAVIIVRSRLCLLR